VAALGTGAALSWRHALERHLDAIQRRDLQALSETVADDLLLITSDGRLKRSAREFLEAHREWFETKGWTLEASVETIQETPAMGVAVLLAVATGLVVGAAAALATAGATAARVLFFQANTSALPPEELVGRPDLVGDGPDELAAAIRAVRDRYGVRALGGCCGTGPEHIAAIARACARAGGGQG